jgi:hypothetical protein
MHSTLLKGATMRNIPIELDCDINKTRFSLAGQIQLEDGSGYCSATIGFERNRMPSGFEPELLSYVSITGYPSVCLAVGPAQNPFALSAEDFQAHRHLDLGSFGELTTTYHSQARRSVHERILFQVKGQVEISEPITGIAPLSEIWIPEKDGSGFQGEMTFTWRLASGRQLCGLARSHYDVPGASLERPQMRVITFDLEQGERHFTQYETIRLYDLQEWKDSVREKIA